MKLVWTANQPDQRGWFWAWDHDSGREPEIIFVDWDEEEEEWRFAEVGNWSPLETFLRFAGPIPSPEETEPGLEHISPPERRPAVADTRRKR